MTLPILTRKSDSFAVNGDGFMVLIDKAEDWTSFDVCKKIRGIVGIKKIGHSGTLDPFATGLMLLGVGKGTKQLHDLIGLDKT